MTKWLICAAVLGSGIAIWRTVGFIRMDPTMAKLKSDSSIFAPTAPRYRYTQPRNTWKLRTTRQKEARRKVS